MATFYPDRPSPDTPGSEIEVWKALEQLPNSWRVFHSVAWQVPKHNRVLDGEADFVLLHKRHGVIVLEVKGGTLRVDNGNWYQRSRNGSEHRLRQSPFEQAKSAMYDIVTYIEVVPRAEGIPKGRAVVLPAASHPGSMGPEAPAEQIISRDELSDLPAAIDRLIEYSKLDADLSPEIISDITGFLAPTRQLRITLSTVIDDATKQLIELTERQTRVLDLLRRHRRALITGGAGTGKTILAIERAKRLAAEGLTVLLVCFNRPLADHIADTIDEDNVVVAGFHQFALDFVKRAGFVANLEPSSDWWATELPDLLPQASERLDERFDAIVIDEGQDFTPEWFMALQLLLVDPDDGPLYVFYDEKQTIYLDEWLPPFDADPFPLDTNCRNTLPIAQRVARVVGADPASLGAEGPDPVWIDTSSSEETEAALGEVVGGLVEKENIDPSQIVVLTDRRSSADELRGRKVGGVALHRLGAKSGGTVETIHRFKGLESDVIIMILSEVEDDRDRALAYIGMSRARALLVVIAPKALKKELDWS